jgi:hypothetical protein
VTLSSGTQFEILLTMRWGVVICALLCIGCKCDHKPAPTTQPSPILSEAFYEPSHASALAFSPPIMQDEAPLDLTRADREPAAFVGYDDLIRTYIYVRTDDRWSGDSSSDRYERRAIIEKVGSSTR